MPKLDPQIAAAINLPMRYSPPQGEPVLLEPPWDVSWSELDTLRQCLFKWWHLYREHWSGGDGEALIRGKMWHEIMAWHYDALGKASADGAKRTKRLEHGAYLLAFDTIRQYLDMHPRIEPPERSPIERERRELLWWMYEGYLDEYGPDADWDIVGIEVPFRTPLDVGGRFWFRGRFDLLVKWRSRLWLVDHKSGKRKPHDKDLDFADQFGLYTWLARQEGHDVWGSIHSWARTEQLKREMTSEDRWKRTPTTRTETQLDTIAREALLHFEQAYEIQQVSDAPRTPDEERCGWKCGLTEACLAGRKGSQRTMAALLASHGHVRISADEHWTQRGY